MNVLEGVCEFLVHVSDLNQFLYCPRRLYYLMYYQTQGMNEYLADGRENHSRQSRRGGWIRELYLHSDRLCLHGKVDLVDKTEGIVPVERKHGDRFYENDQIQLAAYAMLLEESLGERVEQGIIYLYGTGQRYTIPITDDLREGVMNTISSIRSMDPDSLPDFAENRNKCRRCSVLLYCLPEESRILEGIS